MVVHLLAAVEAGGAGSLYNGLEIKIIGIAENLAKSRLDQNSLPAGLVRRMDSKGGDFLAQGAVPPEWDQAWIGAVKRLLV